MKDTRRPSRAMIDKLLKNNGFKLKMSDFIRNSAYRYGIPLMYTIESEKKIEFIESKIDEEAALDAFTQIYAKYFSVDEILDIIAFYRSPTGQKLAKTQDKVAMEMVEQAQLIVDRIVLEAAKLGMKDSLDKLNQFDPDDPYGFKDLNDPDKYEPLD